jgi:phosphoribosylformimino-5-aminoimidazole carboxamide ribonucleotide (ProFAR) isomerase
MQGEHGQVHVSEATRVRRYRAPVTFVLLPAIDVVGGRLGVYTPEGPRPHEAFGGDPVAAARSHVEAGAAWLHVVDMDLAFGGEPRNLEVVAAIRGALPDVRLQASGGIRDPEVAAAYLEAGADRYVLASSALADEQGVGALLSRPAELLVGIEVADGRIRARGAADVDLDLPSTLGWLVAAGAPGFLVTEVGRVATMAGPDLDLIGRVRRAGRPVIAAGGIATSAHVRAVRDAGAVGAVVGRAALEGALHLAEALAWAATA